MTRNADTLRRHSRGTSTAMKRRAVATQCPACGRKNAMQKIRAGAEVVGRVCRWCDHEVVHGHVDQDPSR